MTTPVEQEEAYEEHDVAQALAVTWKEKRRELTKLQRSRKFSQADQLKRSFRVDVEELKRKSRCRICNQLGHWARECKSAGAKGSGKQRSSTTTKASPSGAASVESLVAMVDMMPSPLDWLRCRAKNVAPMVQDSPARHEPNSVTAPHPDVPSCVEQCLVSSPGFGVLDSGCGRSIIGEETLGEFEKMWKDRGIPKPSKPDWLPETNHFRYGNGE